MAIICTSLHRSVVVAAAAPRFVVRVANSSKSRRGGEKAAAPAAGEAGGGTGSSNGNGSYHLSLLFEAPADADGNSSGGNEGGRESSPFSTFDFVCSGSGTAAAAAAGGAGGGEETIGFDRVCALRGEVVHIFTFYHGPDNGGKGRPPFVFSLCVR